MTRTISLFSLALFFLVSPWSIQAQVKNQTLLEVRTQMAAKELDHAADSLMTINNLAQLGAGESRTYLELFSALESMLKKNLQGEKAKQLAVASYRLFSDEPSTMVHMAAVQMSAGQTQDALRLLDLAISRKNSLYPLTAKERSLMARIRGEAKALSGQMDAAQRFFRRALELDPGSQGTRFQLGFLLFQTGQLEKATSTYEQAFTMGRNQAGPVDYLHLAALYLKKKNYVACADLLKKGVEQFPAEPNLRLNLGKALLAQESVAEALFSFYGEMLLLPKDQISNDSAAMKKINQHIEMTLQVAKNIKNNNQRRMVLDFYQGVQHLGEKKPATAVVAFNRVLTMGSVRHLVVRYYLSQALAMSGKERDAIRLQEKLLKEHPTFPPLLASRADLAFIQGDTATGVYFLTQAANISSDNWVVQETMERVRKYLDTIDLEKIKPAS